MSELVYYAHVQGDMYVKGVCVCVCMCVCVCEKERQREGMCAIIHL